MSMENNDTYISDSTDISDNTYKSDTRPARDTSPSDAFAPLWARLLKTAEEAGIRRAAICRWLGASPASSRRLSSPAARDRMRALMRALDACLRENIQEGTLPLDIECKFIDTLIAVWQKKHSVLAASSDAAATATVGSSDSVEGDTNATDEDRFGYTD